jgi:hypothetical protein
MPRANCSLPAHVDVDQPHRREFLLLVESGEGDRLQTGLHPSDLVPREGRLAELHLQDHGRATMTSRLAPAHA